MKKILVVEDNKNIREEICDILEMEGFQFFEAKNGIEGLEKATENAPDLILSDILMPKMNGFEMFEELKNNSATENIPIIFLSAKADKKDIRSGMNLGADDYLTKPMSPEDLLIAIENILQKAEKQEEDIESLRKNISKSIPHELRTPLNGIMGLSDYLRLSVKDIDDEEIKETAQSIFDSSVRLQNVIENFILFTKLKILQSEKKTVNEFETPPNLDSKKIIEEIIQTKVLSSNRISDTKTDIENCIFEFDEFFFRKIISELIDNAVKFSEERQKIEIKSFTDNIFLNFEIINQGFGMTEKEIADIGGFMQFGREKNEQQGSGLGLAIIQLICNIFDVKFEISSEKGKFLKVKLQFRCCT